MREGSARDDAGLGLVEVVVTIFLLSLVAISFLPFLLNSYIASRDNAARSAANSLVADALSRLRAEVDVSDLSCGDVSDWVEDNSVLVTVEGGTDIELAGSVSECTDGSTGAATVVFTGTSELDGSELASASTKVFVTE